MVENKMAGKGKTYQIYPLGYIRRTEEGVNLEILEPFRAAMKQLQHFSHVMVLLWADKHDNERSRSIMRTEPPYAKGKISGVFATMGGILSQSHRDDDAQDSGNG